MRPGLSGYDVCQRIRANPETALLPVVLVTSLDPQQERVKGIEAGADDFLSKPINQPELFARVRSLLRVKALQDEVARQADALKQWNLKLEERVDEQVAEHPLPNAFVVPGANPVSAALDVARSVVRRAERRVVEFHDSGAEVNDEVLRYLNRLSDLLFVMARVSDGGFRPVRGRA